MIQHIHIYICIYIWCDYMMSFVHSFFLGLSLCGCGTPRSAYSSTEAPSTSVRQSSTTNWRRRFAKSWKCRLIIRVVGYYIMRRDQSQGLRSNYLKP